MENNSGSKLIGRRQTFHLLGVGLTAAGVLASVACKQGSDSSSQSGASTPPSPASPPPAPPAEEALSCNSPIEPASAQSRKIMQYKNPAAIPEKHCSACSQFIEAKYGDCGGCKLFTGPVNPNGGCLSFAPKAGAPAAPAKSG